MIRVATPEDVPVIVAMGQRFLAASHYGGLITGRVEPMTALVARLVSDPAHGIVMLTEPEPLVTDEAIGPVGMIGLFVGPHPMSGESTAFEMFWWVEPTYRGQGFRLYREAEAWARAQGATSIVMIAPDADVGRFYGRLGFVEVETSYQRRL